MGTIRSKLLFVLFCTLLFTQAVNGMAIPTKKEILAMEQRVMVLVNEERKKMKLAPQKYNSALYPHAKEHSGNMASQAVQFGHDGFNNRANAIFKTKKFQSVGENVAYTYLYEDLVATSIRMWMKSDGHRENILDDYDQTAVGIVFNSEGRCYLTQLFAKTRE